MTLRYRFCHECRMVRPLGGPSAEAPTYICEQCHEEAKGR